MNNQNGVIPSTRRLVETYTFKAHRTDVAIEIEFFRHDNWEDDLTPLWQVQAILAAPGTDRDKQRQIAKLFAPTAYQFKVTWK